MYYTLTIEGKFISHAVIGCLQMGIRVDNIMKHIYLL